MRSRIIAVLASIALVLGLGYAPAQATVPIRAATPPAPSSQDRVLKGFQAPKGNPKLRPEATSRAMLAGPYYHYALARQILTSPQTSTGIAANLTIENPYVESGGHSLAEIVASDSAQQNYVEVGWRKQAGGVTSVFVFHWKAGAPQGYNVNFTEYGTYCNTAGAICPGDSLAGAIGTSQRFEIQYSGGVWWIGRNVGVAGGGWMGYFNGLIWSGSGITFTTNMIPSGYHETVHSTKTNTCTDMGNGKLPSDTTAARIGSLAIVGLAPAGTVTDFGPTDILPTTTPATVWDSARLSATTMRSGGPGWNAAGTAAGIIGGC